MTDWANQSIEERSLLNPAFCIGLLWQAARGYVSISSRGLSFEESFLVLPMVLAQQTRAITYLTHLARRPYPHKVQERVECDAWESMCASLFLSSKSLVAVFTVYLDESYNQQTVKEPDPPLVYTVGCWISTAGQWKKFNRKWRAELAVAGVEWFHMSEYESRKSDYRDWTNFKRVGVLRRLHRIIKDHTIYGVTMSVNCADFDRIVKGDLKRWLGKNYYSFNVRMIMRTLGEWAERQNIPGPFHYVFAELKGQGNELDAIFRTYLKDPEARKHLKIQGTWTKGLMKEVRPLQAADIVAYEANKRAVNMVGRGPQFVRASLDNLGTLIYQGRIAPLYFGGDQIEHFIRDVQTRRLQV